MNVTRKIFYIALATVLIIWSIDAIVDFTLLVERVESGQLVYTLPIYFYIIHIVASLSLSFIIVSFFFWLFSRELRQTQKKFEQSEMRYRAIFETAPVSIREEDFSEVKIALDKLKSQGITDFRKYMREHPEFVAKAVSMVKIVDVNTQTLSTYDAKTKAELLTSLDKIFVPETLSAFSEELVALAEGKRYFESETTVRTMQGQRRNILFGLTFPQPASQFNSVLVSIMDITERKRLEQALHNSEERFRTIFEQAAESIILFDAETGVITEFNNKAYENLGYTREEFKSLKIPDFEFTEPVEEVTRHIEKIVREGSDTFETKHKRKDGEIRDIKVSSRAISIRGKSYVQSIWSDVTERKQMEEELRRSEEQLRNLSVHLQTLIEEERAAIAREIHDELGTALTALKIDLSWLSNKLPETAGTLREKVKAMSHLVDENINTMQRITSDLRPGVLDDLGLPAAIEWQAGDFEQRTGIKCRVRLNFDQDGIKREIATAFFRIFQEALTNVARHARATEIEASLNKENDKLILVVRDNGRGITEKEASAPESLGLLGMRERARSHGGDVEISGIPGKGTTVTAIVPLSSTGESK